MRYGLICSLLSLACLLGCRPPQATVGSAVDKAVQLKVASAYNLELPVLGDNLTYIADRLQATSDGDLRLKLYDPNKLVAAFEVLDAVSTGKVDAGYSAAGFWSGKMPAAPLFSSIPFGPETGEYMAWMYVGNGLKLYQEMYDHAGYEVKVLICTLLPPETSGWFARPITSAEDLKGLRMRFFGLGGAVMEKLGVAVTQMPGGEIFQNLAKGVIDGTEFSMPVIDERLGFYKVAKYNYFPGWHQQATMLELLINRQVWEKLSPRQQALLELACRAGVSNSIAHGEYSQFQAMRANAIEHGVQNTMWSDEMLELFRRTWDEVVVEQCQADPFFAKVWQDLSEFRGHYDLWEGHAFLPRATAK